MLASLKKKETYKKYFKSFRFAFYCLTHPLDGYWDLTHEKRGSIAVANSILILTLVTRIATLRYTSFLFNKVYWPDINIFLYCATIVFPLTLWCLGNWGLTTLFDGKGRLKQVYMGTCYAMLPYPLINLPLIVISNMVTEDEGSFYTVLVTISLVWAAVWIIAAMMQIHEYTIGKTIFFTVATIFAMLVLIFLLLLFFSMFSSGISYFITIGKEIMFRQ